MSRGVNRVIIVGTLGRDPVVRFAANGTAIANLSVATSEQWKDQQGNKQEKTEWHRVVMFGKLAEIAGQYLKKGSQVYVEGRIQTKKWQGKDGQDRYTTEIVVNQMNMLGSTQARDNSSNGAGYRQPQATQQAQSPPQESADFDDTIPF